MTVDKHQAKASLEMKLHKVVVLTYILSLEQMAANFEQG